jgi:hypothetical protein
MAHAYLNLPSADKRTVPDCKGRNGWFEPKTIEIIAADGNVSVDVYSAKRGREAPIVLWLTPNEAYELGRALIDMSSSTPKE